MSRPTVDADRMLPALAAGLAGALVCAPGALGFSGSHAAVAGHIAFAMGVAPVAMLITSLAAAAAATAIAGAWLAASPWALGFAGSGIAAWSVDVFAGIALIALGVMALRLAAARSPRIADARIGRP